MDPFSNLKRPERSKKEHSKKEDIERKDDYANQENKSQTKEKEEKPPQTETTVIDLLPQSNTIQILKAEEILRADTVQRQPEAKKVESSRKMIYPLSLKRGTIWTSWTNSMTPILIPLRQKLP